VILGAVARWTDDGYMAREIGLHLAVTRNSTTAVPTFSGSLANARRAGAANAMA
jgi:hypothetical protein